MRKPGFARSRPKPSADPRAAVVVAVLLTAGSVAAQQLLQPYEIVGNAIPGSLTGEAGDPARGRAIVLNRRLGACLLCHTGPFAEEKFQGTLAPDLSGGGFALVDGTAQVAAGRCDPP
jgi:L-cysteine S-thiosulfotransferase